MAGGVHVHVPYYVQTAGVTICEECGQVIPVDD